MTLKEFCFYYNEFEALKQVVEEYPITMDQIVLCAKELAKIAEYGKLDIYYRILFDGAHST